MMKGQKNCKPINFFCISLVYGLEIRGWKSPKIPAGEISQNRV